MMEAERGTIGVPCGIGRAENNCCKSVFLYTFLEI